MSFTINLNVNFLTSKKGDGFTGLAVAAAQRKIQQVSGEFRQHIAPPTQLAANNVKF